MPLRVSEKFRDLRSENTAITKALQALQEENQRIRTTLKDTKGIDGGSDIRLYHSRGIKLDDKTTVAVTGQTIRISASDKTIREHMIVGESFEFINANSQNCKLVYLGKPKELYNFSYSCDRKVGKSVK